MVQINEFSFLGIFFVLTFVTCDHNDPPPPLPISDHEYPRDIVNPARYPGRGQWAQPPEHIDVGFVPQQTYSQVRNTYSVKHLPQSDAIASASDVEEVINAPRLREVVKHTQIREVYEEEGFDDNAYDHGGFKETGEIGEGYETKSGNKRKRSGNQSKPASDSEGQYSEIRDGYEGKGDGAIEDKDTEEKTQSKGEKDKILKNKIKPDEGNRSYKTGRVVHQMEIKTDIEKMMDGDKKGKRIRVSSSYRDMSTDKPTTEVPKSKVYRGRVKNDGIGIVRNVLTDDEVNAGRREDGHSNNHNSTQNMYTGGTVKGKDAIKDNTKEEVTDVKPHRVKLRQLTNRKRESPHLKIVSGKWVKIPQVTNVLKKVMDNNTASASNKRETYSEPDSDEEDSDRAPVKGNYLEAHDEEKRLKEEDKIRDQEIEQHYLDTSADIVKGLTKPDKGIDHVKFPFYRTTQNKNSPLRYAMNPREIPLKSGYGMEFYDSKDKHQCEEVKGPGAVVPKRGKDGEWVGQPKAKLPRLSGLGDKIDCFKVKYWGEEPLDNPFFREGTRTSPDQSKRQLIDDDYRDEQNHRDRNKSSEDEANAEFEDFFYGDILKSIKGAETVSFPMRNFEHNPDRVKEQVSYHPPSKRPVHSVNLDYDSSEEVDDSNSENRYITPKPKPKPTPKPSPVRTYQIPHRNKPPIIKVAKPSIPKYNQIVYPGPKHHKIVLELLPTSSNPSSMQPQFRPSPIDDLSNRQQQQPSNVLHSNSNVIKPKRFHPAKYPKQSPNSLKPNAEVVQSERYRPVTQERQPSNTNVVKDDRYMNIVGMHPPPANVHFKYQTLTLMKSNPSQSKTNSEKKFKRNNFYTGDSIKMVDNMAMADSVVDHVSNLTTLKINHNNERVKRATLFDYEEPVTVRLEEEEPVVKTLRKRKRFRNKKKYRKDEAVDSNNQSDNRKDEENGKDINHERKQIKPYLVKEESQEEDEEEDVGPVRRNRKKNTENRSEENSESTDDRNDRRSQYKENKDDRRNNNDDSSDRRNNNDPSERRKNNDDSSERRKNNDDSSDRRNNNDDSSERRKNNDDSSERRNNDNDSSERRNNNDDPSERRNNKDDSSDRRNKNDDPSEESKPYRRRHKKLRKRRPKKYEVYEKQSEEETDGDRYLESNKFHGNSEEYNYPEVNKSQRQTTTEPSYSEEEDENSKERSQPIRRKKIRRRKRPKQRPRNEEDEDEIENADRRNPSWDKVEHLKKPYPIKEIIDEHVYEKHDFKSDEKSAVNEDIGLHDLRKVHSDTINRLRDRHSGLLGNEKSEEEDEEGQEERKGKDEENEEKEDTREKLVNKGKEENEENDGSTEKSVSEEQEGAMEKAGESSSEEITTEKEEQIPNSEGMFKGKKKRTGKGKRRRKEKYSVKESHSEGKSEQDKITDTSTMSPLEEIASQYPKAWKDKKSIDRITERKEIVTTNKNKPEKVEIIKQTTHKNSPETTRGPEEYSVDNRRREPRYKQVVTQDNEEESSNDSHITIHEEVHLSALSGARLPPPIKLSTEEINAKLATLFKGQKFGSRYNAKKPESTLNTMRKLHPEDEGYEDSKTNNTTSESDTKVEGTDKVTLRSRDDSRSRTKNESNESHASVPSKPRTQFSLRSRNITRSRPVLTTTTEAAEPAREETHRSRTQSSHRTKTEDTYKVTVKDVRRSRRPTVKITTASPIVQANHRARSRNRYEGHFVEPISGSNGNAAALTQTNINDIRKLSRKSRDKPTSTQRTGIFDEETAVGVEPPVVTESLKVIDEPVPTTEATTTTTTTTTVATTTTTKAPRRVFLFNRSKPSTIKPEITSKKSPIFQRPKKPEVVLSKTETRQKVPITLRYNIPVRDVIRESDNNIEVVTEKVKLRYIPPRRQPQPQPVEPTTERVTPRRQQPQPVEPITERITPRRQQPQPIEPTTERVIETTTTEKPRVLTNFETRRVTNQETFTTTHKEDDDDDDDDEDDEDDDDNHDGGNADEDDFYPDASENENYYEHSSQNDADNESSSKVETYEEPHDDWISRNSLSFSNSNPGSGYLNPVDSLTRQSWTRDKTLTYVVDPLTDKGRWIQGRS